MPNGAPTKLIISYPSSGKLIKKYNYDSISSNPESQQVENWTDWGDGTTTNWARFFDSKIIITETRILENKRKF